VSLEFPTPSLPISPAGYFPHSISHCFSNIILQETGSADSTALQPALLILTMTGPAIRAGRGAMQHSLSVLYGEEDAAYHECTHLNLRLDRDVDRTSSLAHISLVSTQFLSRRHKKLMPCDAIHSQRQSWRMLTSGPLHGANGGCASNALFNIPILCAFTCLGKCNRSVVGQAVGK